MNRQSVQLDVNDLYPDYPGELLVNGSEEEWGESPSLYFCGQWYPKHRLLSASTFSELFNLIRTSARDSRFERHLYKLWDDDITSRCLRTIEEIKEMTRGA